VDAEGRRSHSIYRQTSITCRLHPVRVTKARHRLHSITPRESWVNVLASVLLNFAGLSKEGYRLLGPPRAARPIRVATTNDSAA